MMSRRRMGVFIGVMLVAIFLVAACARSTPTPTPTPVPPTPTPVTEEEPEGEAGTEVTALLQQALDALEANDVERAGNVLRSALTTTTDPALRVNIEKVLEALDGGEVQEAETQLARLLGVAAVPPQEEDGHGEEAKEGEELVLTGVAKEGYEIYQQVGCAQCHGVQGEGGLGPPLAGHTPDAVIRQVRNPVGNMPAFPPERLSDEDLQKIVAFILALGATAEHAHAPEELTTAQAHMLMTLLTLEDGALEDARHHIEHAIDLSEEPDVQERLRKSLELLDQGQQHDVEHELQELVGTVAPEKNITLRQLHLQLIESALGGEDLPEAEHHLQHFIDLAPDNEKEIAQQALSALQQGDLETAQTYLNELAESKEEEH